MQEFLVAGLIIIFNAGLAYFLLRQLNQKHRPVWALLASCVIGVAAAQLAGVLNFIVQPLVDVQNLSLWGALAVAVVPGVFEELFKVIPVVFFVQSERFFDCRADGVVYFALSGIGFGLYENLQYTFTQGSGVGLIRALSVIFFHAATAGLFGYFYARQRLEPSSGHWWQMSAALVGLMVLHAGYNLSLLMAPAWRPSLIGAFIISAGLSLGLYFVTMSSKASRGPDRQSDVIRAQ